MEEVLFRVSKWKIFGKPSLLPEGNNASIDDKELRKRAKYLTRCKEAMWKRWRSEYLKALRERHDSSHSGNQAHLKAGDVVIVKGEEKNRGRWRIAIITAMILGRDGVVRVVKLRTRKGELETPIQFLYPLELHCKWPVEEKSTLNVEAQEYRPKRRAAACATENIRGTLNYEEDEEL